ncbi:TrkA family potassium uptake protein [Sphingorhabdus sp.]|uniref:potassium channel family protein n=1 Tax=Sphingorhabdus sp. TaxID=1902408 RepID=UPI0035B40ABC|nr:TrkA family potassium uptake protein [Sphingomonadaceae bacterium]
MAKGTKTAEKKSVAVIGLGRFGEAVALRLVELGHEVVGIDGSAEIVQKLADDLPHVVQADSTEAEALRALGVNEVDYAVVAIGSSLEGSVLSVLALQELGITDIWAKASTRQHGLILSRLGVSKVVFPEADMGRALAEQLCGA